MWDCCFLRVLLFSVFPVVQSLFSFLITQRRGSLVKRDSVNYVLVGSVVAVAFVLLIVALALITGRSGVSASYFTHYHNVTGLRYGAPVFYEGYRIGQVGAIEPERNVTTSGERAIRYKVELDVRRDWPIPKDSLARLSATGLLADVAIGISEGSSKEVALPGSELKGTELVDIFRVWLSIPFAESMTMTTESTAVRTR